MENKEKKEFLSFYKEVKGSEGNRCNYPTRLDLYGCGCSHDCKYCLDPNTLILMYDGSSKKIKDLKVGDEIYGVRKEEKYHYYTKSIVLNHWKTEKKSYKITLENGVELICSDNHQWLTEQRGWKHTIGAMTGDDRRPYLTTNNSLLGFGFCLDTSIFEETDDYKKGYLSGVIRGDGHLGIYDYSGKRDNRDTDIQYHFRLALKDDGAVCRTKEYLSYFSVDTNDFLFPMKERESGEMRDCYSIRTHKKENYEKISKLITLSKSSDYLRGFLAGFYDAEGSTDIYVKRVYNTNIELINLFIEGMSTFGFEYTMDKDQETDKGDKTLYTIRFLGGVGEFLRFVQVTNLAIKQKFSFEDVAIKNEYDLKIKSIEPYKDSQELYDITTSTENFIANGVVSHNCYAKSLLSFRGLWHPESPSVANPEKVIRKIDKLPKDMCVRLGGMTDCFQPIEKIERNTYKAIEELNKQGLHYLIVTKSAIVADDEYIALMDKKLAHIQVSITTTDDELNKTYEKASLPSERIKAVEKLQANGFDVQFRLSPFIPQYIDFDILNNVKCDKILIEFLRVNSWIKKWFDIDYSEYTLKSGGYRHLPLETKIKYLEEITGFKEKSICEDVDEHYNYWQENFNQNKKDCCNLNIKRDE